jgi:hypothetical protein
MVDDFSEFAEDTTSIEQQLEESTKAKHELVDCWCQKSRDGDQMSTAICCHGYMIGFTWLSDGAIFCWMCKFDEMDKSIPTHDKFPTMYSDLEFTKHLLSVHLKNGWPKQHISRLPEDVQYGDDWHIPKSKLKQHRECYRATTDRIVEEIITDG